MSQHFFNTICESRPVRVSMGWDRPLQYYFLTVQVLDAEERAEDEDNAVGAEGFLYSNLDDPSVPDVEQQLLYFERQLARLSIDVPRTLLLNLEEDRERNVGNKVVAYQANGICTIVSGEPQKNRESG